MATRHNILVLDSLKPQVGLAEGVARDLGHRVFTHPSPVGVGAVLSKHDIDTVLLEWDLSKQQNAKLYTLMDSWERQRPLKLVVLVAMHLVELAKELSARPDTWVVSFDEIELRLPDVLGQTSREEQASSSSNPPASQFVERLQSRLQQASQAWESIAQGTGVHSDLNYPLAAAQGQAELLAFENLALLLDGVADVARASKVQGGRPSPAQYDAVTAALRFAIHATTAAPYDAGRDVSPLLRRLQRSRT